jgi:hypothetical protein
MGMFDTISISDQLPFTDEMKELGLDARNYSLQTKDLRRSLATYVLQDDKLYLEKYKKEEWVPGDPKAKSLLDRLGYLHREGKYLEDTKYHGTIYACDYRTDVQEKWDCFIDFEITFAAGLVTNKRVAKFEKVDNADRKARDKAWKDEMIASQNRWINKYFFHTRAYRWLGGKVRRALTATAHALQKLAYKI